MIECSQNGTAFVPKGNEDTCERVYLLEIRGKAPYNKSMKTKASISIIIPVIHEEAVINECLTHLRGLPSEGSIEIIVIDGDPEGGTANAIQDDAIIKNISRRGRAAQMNAGAAAASGPILLFLHADTRLPFRALSLIADTLKDHRYCAGAFNLGIQTDRTIFRITEIYAALRTRLTRVPFGDQAIFMRTEYFNTIGGYKDIPLMEDVEIMQRIKKRGDAVCIIPEKVSTSPRRWESEGILRCTVRNFVIQALYYSGVSPERLAKFYR